MVAWFAGLKAGGKVMLGLFIFGLILLIGAALAFSLSILLPFIIVGVIIAYVIWEGAQDAKRKEQLKDISGSTEDNVIRRSRR